MPRQTTARLMQFARVVRTISLGFLYWVAFLLVLEPGNVLGAVRDGHGLGWDREVLRITVAGLLGASTAPVLLALVRRFPIEGSNRRRHALIHLLAGVGLSGVLITASCLLAALFLTDRRPLLEALLDNLAVNSLLLVFAIAGFVAIAHAIRARGLSVPPPPPDYLRRIEVRAKDRRLLLDLDTVDWIESQGNYLALHTGPATHLVRDTISRFEARLDPARFVRIHRGTLVAIDRIRALTPLAAGDGLVLLHDGVELRLSRGFRTRLRAVFDGG